MHKRILLSALALFAMTAASTAQADTKIVVVRASDVVRDSSQYRSAEAKMKAEFEKRKKDLDAKTKDFTEDVKQYQKNAVTMSADQRTKKEADFSARQSDLVFAQRKFQEDLSNRDRELTADMMQKIKAVIVDVAKAKGADIVVQDPVYFNPALDITADVLARLK